MPWEEKFVRGGQGDADRIRNLKRGNEALKIFKRV